MGRFALILLILSFILGKDSNAQVYGEVITFWDFANGIPSDWTNESADGVSQWEYRGPGTSPDNTVCSIGGCGLLSQPPASQSLDNGFVIFDSNGWDDPNGPCGQNNGSGPAPGPHQAYLTTGSIDLSDESNIVLTFQQQYRHNFPTHTYVEISVNQGDWIQLISNPGLNSANVLWSSVNISPYASGQSDVRIRFYFSGPNYWWCLDDIYLFRPNGNDLLIQDPTYTNYNPLLGETGLENLAYHAYPEPFLVEFDFKAKALNVGGNIQGGTGLYIDIKDESNTVVHSQNGSAASVAPGATTNLVAGTWLPDLPIGPYTIEYLVDQSQEDEDPSNNLAVLDFEITDWVYGRDDGVSQGEYTPAPQFYTAPFEIGNVYEITVPGYEMHSIAVAISDSCQAGDLIYGRVYDTFRDTILATTDSIEVNSAFFNSLGDSKYMIIPLQQPLPLEASEIYNVQVGSPAGENKIRVCLSGSSPNQTSFLMYPATNNEYFLAQTPMVRMQVFPEGSNSGCMDELAANFDPDAIYDDNSCLFPGCTDPNFDNYDPEANFEDGTCGTLGCTDPEAPNYDPEATIDDGSCLVGGCTNPEASNYDPDATFDDGSCILEGCTDPEATNYDPEATIDDGSCLFTGCLDEEAENYNPDAIEDDGSCIYDDAQFAINPPVGCAGGDIILTNLTNVVSSGECTIELDGETLFEGCESVYNFSIDEPGFYNITYTYRVNDFESTISLMDYEIQEAPDQPELSFNDIDQSLNCTGCDGIYTEWYLDGLLIDEGESLTSITAPSNGEYTVAVVADNSCSSTSDVVNVTTVGISMLMGSELSVYPNPSNGLVFIEIGNSIDQVQIRVHDATGRCIVNRSERGNKRFSLDLSDQADGIYILNIGLGKEQVQRRLIIQH